MPADRQDPAHHHSTPIALQTSNVAFKMSKIYVDTKSKFQACQIIETLDHGKTLVLDGKTQSAANDEKVYHESLVHPAMMLHPNPKNVYIGGGGEGATMREVLRHKSVEKCVMVDIDEVRTPAAPPPRRTRLRALWRGWQT